MPPLCLNSPAPSKPLLNPTVAINGVEANTLTITARCCLYPALPQPLYKAGTTPSYHHPSPPLFWAPSLALALSWCEASTTIFCRCCTASSLLLVLRWTPLWQHHAALVLLGQRWWALVTSSARAPHVDEAPPHPASAPPVGPLCTQPRYRSTPLWTRSTRFPVEEKFWNLINPTNLTPSPLNLL
jgi:hypothetical protein